MADTKNTPLNGIKVIELGSLIAGPMATRIMADFGAEVIKVEHPDKPDPMRKWGRVMSGDKSMWWAVQSRGKKLMALDIKKPDDFQTLKFLLDEADVLVENFRPGTLEKLGLGAETLWESNPGLIIARISGYGQTGPKAHMPGYASVAEAESGLRYMNGYPDQPPPRTGTSLGDALASLYTVQGVMMALYWRDVRGGLGQIVDTSLIESCFSMLEGAVAEYGEAQVIGKPSGTRLDGNAPSNIYRSLDGIWQVIAANQDSVFARLCQAMDMADLKDDDRFKDHTSRGINQDEIDQIISTWASTHTADQIDEILTKHSVPHGNVNTMKEIFNSELFKAREMIVPVSDEEGRVYQPGIVPKLSLTPGYIRWNGSAIVGKDKPNDKN